MPKSTNHKDLYEKTYENGREIAIVRTEMRGMKDDIRDIKDNHLKALDKKIDRISWLLVLSLSGLATNLAVQLLGK